MDPKAAPQLFPAFFAIWAMLGVGSAVFFSLNRNAALKKRVLPPFLIFTGVLFLGFVFYTGAPKDFLYIAVPMVALIMLLNMRTIRFCDACGRTLYNQNLFSPPKFCSKCGASLKQ